MTCISQKHMINSTPWDILVVLDACRYDYFLQEYSQFFDETPLRVWSSGDGTIQWFKRTWTRRHPGLVYFAANPTLRSGLSPRLPGWNPLDCFDEVVELWRTHWNKYTVFPEVVTDVFTKRGQPIPAVLHFNQPHYPYLGETKFWIPEELMDKYKDNKGAYPLARNKWIIENNLIPDLQKSYRENLRIVLKEVWQLTENLSDLRIIITSDHGEWLGERGLFFHTDGNVNDPILRNVPWLTLDL